MKQLFGSRRLMLLWFVASAVCLGVAYAIDPYIFGLAAFVCAVVSCGVVLGTAVFSRGQLGLALLAALPTLVAFWLLSGFRWA